MSFKIFAQLLALSALWGAAFPMMRIASPLLGPSVLSWLRLVVAVLTLSLLMRGVGQRWPWKDWRELAGLSLLAVAFPFFLFSWAAVKLPAGYIALLNTTAVVFGTLASAWLKEDVLTFRKLLGCASGFLGVALIVQLGPVHPTPAVWAGTAAAVLASFCFGFSTPLMKRATRRLEPLAIAGALHACSLLYLMPIGVWDLPQAHFTPAVWLIVLALGSVNSGLAFWVHLRILRNVTPVAAMSPMFLVPMFGVIWGSIFLDEKLGPGIYLGGTLVLLGAALVTGFNPVRRRPHAPPQAP